MEIITLKTATAETKIFVDISFIDFKKGENYRFAQNDIIIISDSNVNSIYGSQFSEFKVIEITPGEESKSLITVENLYKQLLDLKIDRNWLIIGIGGGVVCDITGFVASTYLRGIRFGFVATTLLAQADAAIGGKNGVNFLGYKNIVGTIEQPEFVICDTSMLRTLPEKEYRCGLAEIVKSAIAGNQNLFDYIEHNIDNINCQEKTVLDKIIYEAIKFKVSVVEKDEKDKGLRSILNLGHTFAHAIESKTGISHGEAVSIGLCKSSDISVKMGLLNKSDNDRIKLLLSNLGLPVNYDYDFEELLSALIKDKKRYDDFINYILINEIGNAIIHRFKLDELRLLF